MLSITFVVQEIRDSSLGKYIIWVSVNYLFYSFSLCCCISLSRLMFLVVGVILPSSEMKVHQLHACNNKMLCWDDVGQYITLGVNSIFDRLYDGMSMMGWDETNPSLRLLIPPCSLRWQSFKKMYIHLHTQD